MELLLITLTVCFSPRNGEVILKQFLDDYGKLSQGFSPRNGEVILKFKPLVGLQSDNYQFQSPQWGSNSKGQLAFSMRSRYRFQSPQWGSNSKDGESS